MFGIKAANKWEAYPFLTFLGTLRSNLHLTSVCSIEITRLSRETGLVKKPCIFLQNGQEGKGLGRELAETKNLLG